MSASRTPTPKSLARLDWCRERAYLTALKARASGLRGQLRRVEKWIQDQEQVTAERKAAYEAQVRAEEHVEAERRTRGPWSSITPSGRVTPL